MNEKSQWKIPVTWQMCGYVKADGATFEEAMNNVRENPDDYPLPTYGTYVDDSFELSTENVEEAKAMAKAAWEPGDKYQ